VGTDRGIRRLAVTAVRDVMRPVADLQVDGRPTVDASGTLYDALAAMLTDDSAEVFVTDNGHPVGVIPRVAVFDVPEKQAEANV
jgi:osmoprotectant transport system ATP-binding protein